MKIVFRQSKKILVGILGFAVLLTGLAMLVLPGPAFLVIPLGLGILATEFKWARVLLQRAKAAFRSWASRNKRK